MSDSCANDKNFMIQEPNGCKKWMYLGKLHRDFDLPAVEHADGDRSGMLMENDTEMEIFQLLSARMELGNGMLMENDTEIPIFPHKSM